jgi:hypothetical protein
VWLCSCSCGGTTRVRTGQLTTGHSKSCGCLRSLSGPSCPNFVHGHSKPTPEYKSWCDMKRRCLSKKQKNYASYGGRGIKVCKRWLNSFENFLADMGPKPDRSYSIERKNNDGNYEHGNCCWATRSQQMANRRPYTDATRKKISDSRKGQKPSSETRRKLSRSLKGRSLSEQHKHRISEAKIRFYARMRACSNV